MYSIKLYKTFDEIKQLRNIWNKIYQENINLTPFQSYEWNECLMENKIYEGELNIFVLYKNDIILMIAPFVKKSGIIYNELYFLGINTHSDYLNFIYSYNLNFEDFQNFIDLVLRKEKRIVLRLDLINEQSPIVDYIKALKVNKEENKSICVKIPIKDTQEEYINILSSGRKKELKRKENSLKKIFNNVEIKFYRDKLEESLIKDLLDLYLVRRKEKKSEMNNQYLQYLQQCITENDKNFVSACFIDKKLSAFFLALITNSNDMLMIMTAIDTTYKKYSIGKILLYYTICHLIEENNTLQEHDLKFKFYDLTRGNESYKYELGGIDHINYSFVLVNKGYLLHMYKIVPKIKAALSNPIIIKRKIFKLFFGSSHM